MQKDYSNLEISENNLSVNPANVFGSNKTVFSELKLSEILLADIDVYKQTINHLNEQHQADIDQIDMQKKEI